MRELNDEAFPWRGARTDLSPTSEEQHLLLQIPRPTLQWPPSRPRSARTTMCWSRQFDDASVETGGARWRSLVLPRPSLASCGMLVVTSLLAGTGALSVGAVGILGVMPLLSHWLPTQGAHSRHDVAIPPATLQNLAATQGATEDKRADGKRVVGDLDKGPAPVNDSQAHIGSLMQRNLAVAEGPLCERCPVGSCYRGAPAGGCKKWPGDFYYCRVRNCSEVPEGMHYSGCWWAEGAFHYTVLDHTHPCRLRMSAVSANSSQGSNSSIRSGSSNPRARRGLPPDNRSSISSTGISLHKVRTKPTPSHFDHRLTAYWDVLNCGPAGDDNNLDWCGGFLKQPVCQHQVAVDIAICESGRAQLYRLDTIDIVHPLLIRDGCEYFYFAQYVCMSLTSTTTTLTTTTSSTTSTMTQTTKTTTSTTTTTSTSTGPCLTSFQKPAAPVLATAWNGVHLPPVCFLAPGPHRVFVIGDWGGLVTPHGPKPAPDRKKTDQIMGVDDIAQILVAQQMVIRAGTRPPDYILNVGDSFYWGGLPVKCGSPANVVTPTEQLDKNFEAVYRGPGLDGKPWLGVLGNHDYGGYRFDQGWDQLIGYTWGNGGRWVMPAQYWRATVHYPEFAVDYFFLDNNVFDAAEPHADPNHNVCSLLHNPEGASCGAEGPKDVWSCASWFARLWEEQKNWLEMGLAGSAATWQILVTHFPPTWGTDFWKDIVHRQGIDLITSGHVHRQVLYTGADPADKNFLTPTAWLVSGGGGGITSEDLPERNGLDDQYGFFELTLSKEAIEIVAISHGGQVRSTGQVRPRPRADLRLGHVGAWESLTAKMPRWLRKAAGALGNQSSAKVLARRY